MPVKLNSMNINQKRSKITKSVLKRFPDLEPLQELERVAKQLKKFQKKNKVN